MMMTTAQKIWMNKSTDNKAGDEVTRRCQEGVLAACVSLSNQWRSPPATHNMQIANANGILLLLHFPAISSLGWKVKVQARTWRWASESGNVAAFWRPSLVQGLCLLLILCSPEPLFPGWVTYSDRSTLTRSLGTRTPTELTLLALLRYDISYLLRNSWEIIHVFQPGVDGRLQEVVLHASSWPPQLWNWLRVQQTQVQTGW